MSTQKRGRLLVMVAVLLSCALSLGSVGQELGSIERPVRFFVNAGRTDLSTLEGFSVALSDYLLDETGVYVEVLMIAPSLIADFLRTEDEGAMGILPAYDYIMLDGGTVRLCGSLLGAWRYATAIYARRDSGIRTLADLAGRIWAHSHWGSLAGYIVPADYFAAQGIVPSAELVAQLPIASVEAVMNGNADFATASFSPPSPPETCAGAEWTWGDDPEKWLWDSEDGALLPRDTRGICHDARAPFDDEAVLSEVGVVALLGPIPSECLAFSPGFPADLEQLLADAIASMVRMEAGEGLWAECFGWTDVEELTDGDFDCLRRLTNVPIPGDRAVATCSYESGMGLLGVSSLSTPQILTCVCQGFGQAVRMFLQAVPSIGRIVGGHIGRLCFNIDIKNETGVDVDNLEIVIKGVVTNDDVSSWYNGYPWGPRFRNHEAIPNCARNETVLRWWGTTVRPGEVVHVGACVRRVARLQIKRVEWTRGPVVAGPVPACSFALVDRAGSGQFAWQMSNASDSSVTVSDVALATLQVNDDVPLEALNPEELEPALAERGVTLEPQSDAGGELGPGRSAPLPFTALSHSFSIPGCDFMVILTVNPFDPDPQESYTLSVTTIPAQEGLVVKLRVEGSDEWTCASQTTTGADGIARFPTSGDRCDGDTIDGRIPGADANTIEEITVELPSVGWTGKVTFVF